jgi:hypothetical protein
MIELLDRYARKEKTVEITFDGGAEHISKSMSDMFSRTDEDIRIIGVTQVTIYSGGRFLSAILGERKTDKITTTVTYVFNPDNKATVTMLEAMKASGYFTKIEEK